MITAKHMGKLGDVVYALPTIKALGVEVLYLPESTPDDCPHLYSNIRSLLELQPYIKEVREYPSGLPYMELAPGIDITYDLDRARLQPGKGVIHIVKRYMDQFGITDPNWKQPWLVLDDQPSPIEGEYVLINYTGRHIINERIHHGSFDWKKLVTTIAQRKIFVGTEKEYSDFCYQFCGDTQYFPTKNLLELARVIRGCKSIYLNQSASLALSQSLGVEYYLYPKPGKRNCILGGVPYEHILQ